MSNLRLLRDRKGISQIDLAKRINTTQKSISQWENGHTEVPSFFLKPISDILECSFEEILGYPTPAVEKIVYKEPDLNLVWYIRQLPRFNNMELAQILGACNYVLGKRTDNSLKSEGTAGDTSPTSAAVAKTGEKKIGNLGG